MLPMVELLVPLPTIRIRGNEVSVNIDIINDSSGVPNHSNIAFEVKVRELDLKWVACVLAQRVKLNK